MSKCYPSQFDCDNMEPGDMVIFKKRGFLYRYIREHFLNNKVKIRVRKNWLPNNNEYDVYYQEDCTLMYRYELYSTQKKTGVMGRKHRFITYDKPFDISVDLDNLYITEKSPFSIVAVPVHIVEDLLEQKQKALINENRRSFVKQAVKCCRYDGKYFRRIVTERNILSWNMLYCSVCGKPMTLLFGADNIHIDVQCKCGNLKADLEDITYDDFAVTFNSSTSESARKLYDDFWINNVGENNG